MQYKIILNMPTENRDVHQVIVEHEAETLEAFMKAFARDGYVIGHEYYWQPDKSLKLNAPIAVSFMVFGKAAKFEMRQTRRDGEY